MTKKNITCGHPNSKANQIFADSIYMDLKNQSLIDKK